MPGSPRLGYKRANASQGIIGKVKSASESGERPSPNTPDVLSTVFARPRPSPANKGLLTCANDVPPGRRGTRDGTGHWLRLGCWVCCDTERVSTEERDARIRYLSRQGWSVRQIAREENLSKSQVHRVLISSPLSLVVGAGAETATRTRW